MKSISEPIFDRGLAIGGANNRTGEFHFRYRTEDFILRKMRLSNGPGPTRCVPTFSIPELKYGFVARIEDIRAAMAFEAPDV